MYVFELSFPKQKALAEILDTDDAWEDLAGLMNLTADDVIACRNASKRNQSPASELLRILASLGYPVEHLFKLLFKMRHLRAMKALSDVVDKKCLQLVEKLKVDRDEVPSDTTGGKLGTDHIENSQRSAVDLYEEQSNRVCGSVAGSNNKSATSNGDSLSDSAKSAVSVLDNTLSIPFEDLRLATGDFSSQNVLGRGGYGVVYRAKLKHSVAAVKRISCPSKAVQNLTSGQFSEEERGRWRQSLMELRISALYRHDNILPLYGHSFDGPEPCLVYQYMPMGSLEDRLLCRKVYGEDKKSSPLNWDQRMKIMTGAIRGLNFLHTVCKEPLIHGDVKSANILLDTYLEPKLGDFGLSRRGRVEIPSGAPPLIASHIKGTLAYLPPEFIRNKHLSSKLDVYSFGVVLFEVSSGFRAYSDRRTPENLVDYVHSLCECGKANTKLPSFQCLVDVKAGQDTKNFAEFFINLGLQCCRKDPQMRLSSGEVLCSLETRKSRCTDEDVG